MTQDNPSLLETVETPAPEPRDSAAVGPGLESSRERGFTLIEIMAVVVIMGMLMATLAVGISGQLRSAEKKNAELQINRLEQALEFYRLDNRRFPTTDQGLEALIQEPTAPPLPRDWNPEGYTKRDSLEDPWGQPIQYRAPGEHNPYSFDLWSYGPDGVEGGDDIVNWDSGNDA